MNTWRDDDEYTELDIKKDEPSKSEVKNKEKAVKPAKQVKSSKRSRLVRKFRNLMSDPNMGYQLMTILLTLSPDNAKMERRIDTMTTTVDKVRNISDLINNTMHSLKTAAETPKQIRKLLE